MRFMPLLMQRLLALRTCQVISHDWSKYGVLRFHSGVLLFSRVKTCHVALPLISHVLQGDMSLKFRTTTAILMLCVRVLLSFSWGSHCWDAAIRVCSQVPSVTEKRTSAGQTHATSTDNGLHAKTGFHKERHWVRKGKSKLYSGCLGSQYAYEMFGWRKDSLAL